VLTNIVHFLVCIDIAATMHEVGHTMGLTHSNEDGRPYADFSGYMAAGYKSTDWPRKCFNGHKVRIELNRQCAVCPTTRAKGVFPSADLRI
jgi:hypothetical protein